MYRAMQFRRKTMTTEDRILLNTYVECELLHLRNLVEAFLLAQVDNDGIKVHRLLADRMTDELLAAIGRLTLAYFAPHKRDESPKAEIDKRLAHMTTKRTDGTGHEYDECFAVVEPVVERVIGAIEAIRGKWCADLSPFLTDRSTVALARHGSTASTSSNW